jgi:hypothetical protein
MTEDRFGFARALSLARPGVPIPYKDLRKLALEVISDRPRLAMDQDPDELSAPDPRSAAIYRLAAHLADAISDPDDRQVAFDLCREALRAGSSRGEDAEAEQRNMAQYATRSAATSGKPSDPTTFGQKPEGDWPSNVPSPFSTTVRKVPTGPGNAVDSRRRRLAADEGPGPLDALFAEFPAASRPFG